MGDWVNHLRHLPRRARGVLLFLLIPGVSAVSPVLLYPAITEKYGAAGFASVAIGQSIGFTTAVVCELGWSVTGPQAVAGGADLSNIHRASLATKLLMLSVGLPIAAVVAYVVAQSHQDAAALTAIALALSALSPIWLLTGMNRPDFILLVDVVPRLLLTVLSAAAIMMGASLVVYAIAPLVTTMISVPLAATLGRYGIVPGIAAFRAAPQTIRAQLPLTFGRSVSVTYTTAVTALVGVLSPAAVALYAATDRILRMGLAVLAGFPARLQSWIWSGSASHDWRRARVVMWSNAALGVAAGAGFFILAPPVAGFLFSGQVEIDNRTALLGSLIAFAVCFSRGLGLVLVSVKRQNAIAAAALLAAVVGLSLLILTPLLGAGGALIAVAGAEMAGIVVQGAAIHAATRRRKGEGSW